MSEVKLNVNEEEIKLIKSVYKDNENLLQVTRACLFGFKLSESDKALLKSTYSNNNLIKVMYKKFLPTLDREAPIGQVSDIWLGVEQQVFGHSRDTIEQAVQYKRLAVEMTDKGLKRLQDPELEGVDLSFEISSVDSLQTGLLARNQYIRHVEQQLLMLKVISEQKEETTEEVEKRIAQNSNR